MAACCSGVGSGGGAGRLNDFDQPLLRSLGGVGAVVRRPVQKLIHQRRISRPGCRRESQMFGFICCSWSARKVPAAAPNPPRHNRHCSCEPATAPAFHNIAHHRLVLRLAEARRDPGCRGFFPAWAGRGFPRASAAPNSSARRAAAASAGPGRAKRPAVAAPAAARLRDAAPNFRVGDWTVVCEIQHPRRLGGQRRHVGTDVVIIRRGKYNGFSRPPSRVLGQWQNAPAASATPAMSSHRVKFAKLKPISICQASLLDNPRQK